MLLFRKGLSLHEHHKKVRTYSSSILGCIYKDSTFLRTRIQWTSLHLNSWSVVVERFCWMFFRLIWRQSFLSNMLAVSQEKKLNFTVFFENCVIENLQFLIPLSSFSLFAKKNSPKWNELSKTQKKINSTHSIWFFYEKIDEENW